MAPRKGEYDGVIVCAPDGKFFLVVSDKEPLRVPEPLQVSEECKKAFEKVRQCLKIVSDVVVLSGVVTRANGKALSRKPVGRRSAKRGG
jgi:hypothetical protein